VTITITSEDKSGHKRVYRRKTMKEAVALVGELTAKGLHATMHEGGRGKARRNPSELLVLSGFIPNPERAKTLVDDHDLTEVEDAFAEFHAGAPSQEILELPDDAAPPGTPKHLFALGRLVAVVYEVPGHSGKAPGAPFEHLLGEAGNKVIKKNRPMLCATADGKHLVIVHANKPGTKGTYRVRPEGIVG